MQGKLDVQRIDGNQSSVACWSLDMRGYVRLCGCAVVRRCLPRGMSSAVCGGEIG